MHNLANISCAEEHRLAHQIVNGFHWTQPTILCRVFEKIHTTLFSLLRVSSPNFSKKLSPLTLSSSRIVLMSNFGDPHFGCVISCIPNEPMTISRPLNVVVLLPKPQCPHASTCSMTTETKKTKQKGVLLDEKAPQLGLLPI
jgi:hypothetical protein